MTSQNVALWDINIALWALYLLQSPLKNDYLTFNWHYTATSWNFLMRFSAKRFALAALSAYYNHNQIVKTLSFDLQVNNWPISNLAIFISNFNTPL